MSSGTQQMRLIVMEFGRFTIYPEEVDRRLISIMHHGCRGKLKPRQKQIPYGNDRKKGGCFFGLSFPQGICLKICE